MWISEKSFIISPEISVLLWALIKYIQQCGHTWQFNWITINKEIFYGKNVQTLHLSKSLFKPKIPNVESDNDLALFLLILNELFANGMLLNFPHDLPIPLAAYIFLGSIRITCIKISIALFWFLFTFILSLNGVWRVCNQTFPIANNAYVSLAVAGWFNIRLNFSCPGPHSFLAKWRFPINVKASGWCYNMNHYSCLFIENPCEIFQKGSCFQKS